MMECCAPFFRVEIRQERSGDRLFHFLTQLFAEDDRVVGNFVRQLDDVNDLLDIRILSFYQAPSVLYLAVLHWGMERCASGDLSLVNHRYDVVVCAGKGCFGGHDPVVFEHFSRQQVA